MIRHVVMWRMRAEGPGERARTIRALREAFAALPSEMEGVRAIRLDGNVIAGAGNYDLVLTADFDDSAALARYQAHPAHLAVAADVRAATTERAAVDYEL